MSRSKFETLQKWFMVFAIHENVMSCKFKYILPAGHSTLPCHLSSFRQNKLVLKVLNNFDVGAWIILENYSVKSNKIKC